MCLLLGNSLYIPHDRTRLRLKGRVLLKIWHSLDAPIDVAFVPDRIAIDANLAITTEGYLKLRCHLGGGCSLECPPGGCPTGNHTTPASRMSSALLAWRWWWWRGSPWLWRVERDGAWPCVVLVMSYGSTYRRAKAPSVIYIGRAREYCIASLLGHLV